MRLDELEQLMEENPEEAASAIAGLVTTANVEELASIVKSARPEPLAMLAIEGLGDVGGAEATDALVELLDDPSARFLIGGTEQEVKQEHRQRRLVQAAARASGVPAPSEHTQDQVAEFIESVRRR